MQGGECVERSVEIGILEGDIHTWRMARTRDLCRTLDSLIRNKAQQDSESCAFIDMVARSMCWCDSISRSKIPLLIEADVNFADTLAADWLLGGPTRRAGATTKQNIHPQRP